MQMRPPPAVLSVARQSQSRPAFFPRTGAAEILASLISHEDVGSAPATLEPTLETPRKRRKDREISSAIDPDQ
jgi:hypothetical protein